MFRNQKEIERLSLEVENLSKKVDELEISFEKYSQYIVDVINKIYENFGDTAKLEKYLRKEKIKKLNGEI